MATTFKSWTLTNGFVRKKIEVSEVCAVSKWKHLWEDNLCERKAKAIYYDLRKNTGTRDHYIITRV